MVYRYYSMFMIPTSDGRVTFYYKGKRILQVTGRHRGYLTNPMDEQNRRFIIHLFDISRIEGIDRTTVPSYAEVFFKLHKKYDLDVNGLADEPGAESVVYKFLEAEGLVDVVKARVLPCKWDAIVDPNSQYTFLRLFEFCQQPEGGEFWDYLSWQYADFENNLASQAVEKIMGEYNG